MVRAASTPYIAGRDREADRCADDPQRRKPERIPGDGLLTLPFLAQIVWMFASDPAAHHDELLPRWRLQCLLATPVRFGSAVAMLRTWSSPARKWRQHGTMLVAWNSVAYSSNLAVVVLGRRPALYFEASAVLLVSCNRTARRRGAKDVGGHRRTADLRPATARVSGMAGRSGTEWRRWWPAWSSCVGGCRAGGWRTGRLLGR